MLWFQCPCPLLRELSFIGLASLKISYFLCIIMWGKIIESRLDHYIKLPVRAPNSAEKHDPSYWY